MFVIAIIGAIATIGTLTLYVFFKYAEICLEFSGLNTHTHSAGKVTVRCIMSRSEANLVLKEDYCPIFHKAYSVPFTLQRKVEEELNKMVEEGVLVPTKYSEWASPVVIVEKENGSVRLCLDGKATLNKYLSMEHYPLPKIEDIFAKISDWKLFCKIDLSGACLQVKLFESAKQICTINTSKGLINYTRMPFGIHTAPAIFQSIIDQILRNTKGLAYIDDIIVGGKNAEECKTNLYEVMEKLNSHNVKIMRISQFFMCHV